MSPLTAQARPGQGKGKNSPPGWFTQDPGPPQKRLSTRYERPVKVSQICEGRPDPIGPPGACRAANNLAVVEGGRVGSSGAGGGTRRTVFSQAAKDG